jgi:hypothetical protein
MTNTNWWQIGVGVYVVLMLALLVRNELVRTHREQAREIIFSLPYWWLYTRRLKEPSYFAMVFDFRRWKFRHFYPDLAIRLAAEAVLAEDDHGH